MNFRAFYENRGVDYDAFLQRMMGKEALVEKYIRIFIADSTYSELAQAMAVQDIEAAEFKAHALKGIALNLNFEKLGILCMDMVNSVRNNIQELDAQFDRVKAEYESIMKELGN